jgi:hypothetical protein
MLANIPTVKIGIVAVSRSCFPKSLSERRRAALAEACGDAYCGMLNCSLFEVFKYPGVDDTAYNRPKTLPYPGENPFA